jgi:hypothetical protein
LNNKCRGSLKIIITARYPLPWILARSVGYWTGFGEVSSSAAGNSISLVAEDGISPVSN